MAESLLAEGSRFTRVLWNNRMKAGAAITLNATAMVTVKKSGDRVEDPVGMNGLLNWATVRVRGAAKMRSLGMKDPPVLSVTA